MVASSSSPSVLDKPRARSFNRRVVFFEDGSIEAVGEMTSEETERDNAFATVRKTLIITRTALVSSNKTSLRSRGAHGSEDLPSL